jgi:hypothetical protein
MDSQLHKMISIVRLPRRCVLGPDVTGTCDVVSVTRPSPCARMPQNHRQSVDVGEVSAALIPPPIQA